MIGLLLIVVAGSTIWVAFDSAGRDFSTTKRWVLAQSPLGWVFGCLVLWIIFFPAYLAMRSRTPLKQREGP
jgi:hypothetical protein